MATFYDHKDSVVCDSEKGYLRNSGTESKLKKGVLEVDPAMNQHGSLEWHLALTTRMAMLEKVIARTVAL
eukprot:6382968-Ditylum_brightwellii.AAC.1